MGIFLLVLLGGVVLAIPFTLARNRRRGPSDRRAASSAKTNRAASTAAMEGRYRAVSISPAGGACAEAVALEGKRFLRAEAPVLPLSGCSKGRCDCVYAHHPDRRSGDGDRRLPHSLESELFSEASGQSERRARRRGGGRRREDRGGLSPAR